MKKYIPLLVILILTFFITFNSFIKPGMYKTHDGDYHVTRAIHFYSELIRGQFPVRMSVDVPYSYGYSTFEFFYPFPYYASALFQFAGISAALSWKFIQVLITLASLIAFFMWIRKHLDTFSAIIATIAYALVPFRFLTLYVTGQMGGYLGLFFASLIGLGLHQLLSSRKNNGVLLSIAIAGLIISHLISLIIFFIPLSIYAIYLLYKNFSKQKVLTLVFWTFLGICLSSFYLIPFLLEKSWVKLGNEVLIDYTDHWATAKQLIYSPWGYGSSDSSTVDTMSFQVGLSLFLAWITTILIIFIKKPKDKLIYALTIIFGLLIFLMTSYSRVIWGLIEPLQLIQFPWRLLAATSLVGSFLVGFASQQFSGKKRIAFAVLIILVSTYNIRNYTKPWPNNWKTDNDYIKNAQDFYGPTDISWELMPITATNKPTKTPPLILNATSSAILINDIIIPETGKVKKIVEVELTQPAEINLALWDLPVWIITVDENLVNKKIAQDGTIIIPVDEGQHKIKIILEKTQIQKNSDLITLFSFIFLILYIAFPQSRKSAVK